MDDGDSDDDETTFVTPGSQRKSMGFALNITARTHSDLTAPVTPRSIMVSARRQMIQAKAEKEGKQLTVWGVMKEEVCCRHTRIISAQLVLCDADRLSPNDRRHRLCTATSASRTTVSGLIAVVWPSALASATPRHACSVSNLVYFDTVDHEPVPCLSSLYPVLQAITLPSSMASRPQSPSQARNLK